MRLYNYLLILVYAVNNCQAGLPDDGNYAKDAIIRQLKAEDPNRPGLIEVSYDWEGVIKSMFADEKNTCLTPDAITGLADNGEPQVLQNGWAGMGVGIYKCPDKVEYAKDHHKWFIKGSIVGGLDPGPVFEGYIRSGLKTGSGNRLCLTARKDPGGTPLSSYKSSGGSTWPEQSRFYDWNDKQGSEKSINPKAWVYHRFFTSWGTVSLELCEEGDPTQTWLIELLKGGGGGGRQLPDDPSKWIWIRPKEMGWHECAQPERDVPPSYQGNDGWCKHRGDRDKDAGCIPNYPFHGGLMRPYIVPGLVDKEKKVQFVMVGCSPSNWMPQYNFGILNDEGKDLRGETIGETIPDSRVSPFFVDLDLAQSPDPPHVYNTERPNDYTDSWDIRNEREASEYLLDNTDEQFTI